MYDICCCGSAEKMSVQKKEQAMWGHVSLSFLVFRGVLQHLLKENGTKKYNFDSRDDTYCCSLKLDPAFPQQNSLWGCMWYSSTVCLSPFSSHNYSSPKYYLLFRSASLVTSKDYSWHKEARKNTDTNIIWR